MTEDGSAMDDCLELELDSFEIMAGSGQAAVGSRGTAEGADVGGEARADAPESSADSAELHCKVPSGRISQKPRIWS